jgi:hypothetical protein
MARGERVVNQTCIGAGVMSLALAAAPGFAQSSGDVPDRFRIELGGFRVGSNTNLRLNNGTGGGTDIAFESELDLPKTSTSFYAEGYWRLARRHQVSLGWFHTSREGPGKALSRDIVWGDHVFTVGSQVKAAGASDYFSGAYRFAAYRSDQFEIGPSIGIGHLSLDASISAVGGAGPAFEGSASKGQVTGDIGAYLYWWPVRRLLVRGEGRYIIVQPGNSEAAIAEGRGAVMYHPWRQVGAGVQYAYTQFRYDRGILDTTIGGTIRYRGFQFLVAAAF